MNKNKISKNEAENSYDGVQFCVQIAASSKKLDLQPYNFNGLNDVHRKKEGKLYKYYYGATSDYEKIVLLKNNAKEKLDFLINNKGSKSVDYFHKKLGKIMWNKCGMARNKKDLESAIKEISELRNDFYKEVKVPGDQNEFNEELAKAGRVADFLELGELFAKDALEREESCGGHFRDEYQTKEGEATRKKEFQFVSAWEYVGEPKNAILHKEKLEYENIEVKERSYK